jgi:hypothetical protein
VFKRRRSVSPDEEFDNGRDDGGQDDVRSEGTGPAGKQAAAAPVGAPVRPQGPWDVSDAPDDELLDLGGLRIPIVEGFDISLTADEGNPDQPVVVSYAGPDGAMQLHAFAAPKTSGIWADVCREIAESLRESGGQAQDAQGSFGPELRATIPVPQPDGSTGYAPARFVGVDGPRWFLRAMIHGPIVDDRDRVAALEDVLRRVVVVRGGDAMAPREVIPLRPPRELVEAAEAAEATQDAAGVPADQPVAEQPSLQLPERGPEITEVR